MKRIGFFIACMLFGIALAFAQEKAEISISETTHDFGTVYEEDGDATCEFIITNTGTAPLELKNVTAGCGCTKPSWTDAPVAPGKTGSVKVAYRAKGRIGPIDKSISIYSNAQEGPFIVFIKGKVVSKASIDLSPKQESIISIEPVIKSSEIKQDTRKKLPHVTKRMQE